MDNGSEEDENDMLESGRKSSLPLPMIDDNNFVNNAEFEEEFLRLTSMVRRVYFSYLHKCLLSNYAISCPSKNIDDFESQIKNCASQMELFAVRSALETTLYRKAMTKLISDVKEHTNEQILYKKLTSSSISTQGKTDIAVQTDEIEIFKTENSNTSQTSASQNTHSNELKNNLSEVTLDSKVFIKIEPVLIDSNLGVEPPDDSKLETELSSKDLTDQALFNDLEDTTEPSFNNLNVVLQDEVIPENSMLNFNADSSLKSQTLNETQLFENTQQNLINESVQSKTEDSQDSIFQTMEDMFCESDDSSDLMTLIEKHSSAPTCSENSNIKTAPKTLEVVNNFENKLEPKGSKRKRNSKTDSEKTKRRSSTSSPAGFNELKSSKYRKKVDEIWLVERVHQTSKLKSKMLEISLMDYRKYGRIKRKFAELFGESDDEEAMLDSPVCIEEHLQACKERIAPWIVKHLTPFYSQKKISSRELFKTVCRHITDMLIINNTFPEETCVQNYIGDFFKNKKSIKTEADIYL